MIGAEPNTGWLYGTVRLDKKGFILTGGVDGFENTPYATSVPGIYAVGDVRANSVKRVASAVGEGSVVISDVHRYLANAPQPRVARTGLRPGSPPRGGRRDRSESLERISHQRDQFRSVWFSASAKSQTLEREEFEIAR